MRRFNFSTHADSSGLERYIKVLGDAREIVTWHALVVPDALQNPQYAQEATGPHVMTPELLAEKVKQRILRQETLREAGVPTTAYVGEAALRQRVTASRKTMYKQVGDIARLISEGNPDLLVGIVPLGTQGTRPVPLQCPAGVDLATTGTTWSITTEGGPRFVFTHDATSAICMKGEGLLVTEAQQHERVMREIAKYALTGDPALELLAQIQEYHATGSSS